MPKFSICRFTFLLLRAIVETDFPPDVWKSLQWGIPSGLRFLGSPNLKQHNQTKGPSEFPQIASVLFRETARSLDGEAIKTTAKRCFSNELETIVCWHLTVSLSFFSLAAATRDEEYFYYLSVKTHS
jgi:hypothetical protein